MSKNRHNSFHHGAYKYKMTVAIKDMKEGNEAIKTRQSHLSKSASPVRVSLRTWCLNQDLKDEQQLTP